jgi:sugar phosphate isomerase/epimerase
MEITRRGFMGCAAGVVASAGLAGAATDDAKKGWQIGCYTRPWSAHPYTVALDAIAEAGFKYAGLMTTKSKNSLVISVETTIEEAAAIGEECKKRGLSVPSVYGGDIPVAKSLEAGIEGMHRLIDCCAAANIANLMMGGVGDEKLYDIYYKAIGDSCDYAAGKGIGVSVKPHGGLNSMGPQCRKIIESVGKKNFRLWYDPGNIFYYSDGKLNPVDDAATVDGIVCGMSVKDFVLPKVVDVTPGDGQVEFPKVMARLVKGGFTGGPLIIECLKPGELPQLLAEAKKARQLVESLVAGLK